MKIKVTLELTKAELRNLEFALRMASAATYNQPALYKAVKEALK